MNIKKSITYISYSVGVLAVIVLLAGYSSAKTDYGNAGKECNLQALNSSQSDSELLIKYETYYLTCMRSNGYLLESVKSNR
jgi:hypothetical protein